MLLPYYYIRYTLHSIVNYFLTVSRLVLQLQNDYTLSEDIQEHEEMQGIHLKNSALQAFVSQRYHQRSAC